MVIIIKVLYVTSRPPWPPHKGDQMIAFEQLRTLNKRHEIFLLSVYFEDIKSENIKIKMKDYCKDIYLIKISKFQSILRCLKTFVNLKPFQVNMYYNKKVQIEIDNLINNIKPDIIHVQTVRVASYFMKHPECKVIDMVDLLSLNMRRRAEQESIFRKLPFLLESLFLKRFERYVINHYDRFSLVSANDIQQEFNASEFLNRLVVNPNGTYMTPQIVCKYKREENEKSLIFHGNMQYFPNENGVLYFVKNIFPNIKKRHHDIKFYIVGKDPTNKINKLHDGKNVIVTGYVEDICDYLTKSLIGVYTLYSGTGMQNKILEALACGLPTVATPIALQGIPEISNDHLLLSRTDKEVIDNIELLINNVEIRNRLSTTAKKFVFESYTWNNNAKKLEEMWYSAIGQRNSNLSN